MMSKETRRFGLGDGLAVFLVLTVILGVLSAMVSIGPVTEFVSAELRNPRTLTAPVAVALDDQSRVYVIEAQHQQLLSFTPEGQELWRTPNLGAEGLSSDSRLVARPRGGVVVSQTIPSVAERRGLQSLVSYDSTGHREGPLVILSGPQKLDSFEVRGEELWYQVIEDVRISVRTRPLAVGGPVEPSSHRVLFEARLANDLDLVQSAPLLPEGLVLVTRKGELLLMDSGGRLSVPPFAPAAGLRKPGEVRTGADGSILILDRLSRSVFRAANSQSTALSRVFDQEEVVNTGRPLPTFSNMGVSSTGRLALADRFAGTVYLPIKGESPAVVTQVWLDPTLQTWRAWLVVFPVLFLVSFVTTLFLGFRRLFATRVSIVVKQGVFLVPLVLLSGAIGTTGLLQWLEVRDHEQTRTKLMFMAALGKDLIDGDLVRAIQEPSDLGKAADRSLSQRLSELTSQEGAAGVSVTIYQYRDGQFFVVAPSTGPSGILDPFGGAQREHLAAARGGTLEFVRAPDGNGTRWSALAPVKNSSGATVGLLEVSQTTATPQEFRQIYAQNLSLAVLLSLGWILCLLIVLSLARRLVRRLAQEVSVPPALERRGVPSAEAATMNTRQLEHFGRLRELAKAVGRFVPRGLLELLGKDRPEDVVGGDQVRRTVSLVFGHFIDWSGTDANLTARQALERHNAVLSSVLPLVQEHRGFLFPDAEAGFVAVFSGPEAEAKEAAHQLLEGLAKQTDSPKLGLALHRGPVTLGVNSDGRGLVPFLDADELISLRALARQALQQGGGLSQTPTK